MTPSVKDMRFAPIDCKLLYPENDEWWLTNVVFVNMGKLGPMYSGYPDRSTLVLDIDRYVSATEQVSAASERIAP